MAGGKETPRQKLIGIMYLILLVLLALQVSSAIMEKFKFLDDSLQAANDRATALNTKTAQNIEKAVSDNGNKAADLKVLEKSKQVRAEAKEIRDFIEKLREEIIQKTGGYEDPNDKTSMYKGAKDQGFVEDLMVGAKKGIQLQKEVNEFCEDLRRITGKPQEFPNLALDAKDDPRISSKSENKKQSFSELNFTHTPMVAAMAVLSDLEASVLKHEAKALEDLAAEVGATEIKFDNIFAMYRAESKVVAAGTKYNAELFLAASSSTLKPTIKVDGRDLQVDKDGRGKLEFTATGGAYDNEGNAKKSWNGQITIKNKGKDTTFTVKGEYIVAKPVIQIQSASVSALYRNCGNELIVGVPALGSTYQPSFAGSSGGEFITGTEKGKVTIIPNSPEVTLKVSSGGNFIGDQKFKVRLVPLPTIELMAGGAKIDEKAGLDKNKARD
ncbi:MAG: gliding motility protein GldM, partial [Cytophagales bacterium]